VTRPVTAVGDAAALRLGRAGRRQLSGRWPAVGRALRDRNACTGLVIVLVAAAAAVLAPVLAHYDPLDISARRLASPSRQHLLGTDALGRDVLSRVLHGARQSLGGAAIAGVLVLTIGVVVGVVAGFFGSWVDAVLMRLVDFVLAVPGLVLAFAIAGLFRPGLMAVLLGIVSLWWAQYARVVRSLVLQLREQQFIEAARAAGAGNARLVLRHILPNVAPAVIVLLTVRLGRLILAIAGLNFLGLGVQAPTPEWAAMLNEARPYFPAFPHLVLAPGLAIAIVVFGLNLLGDGLRDLLDPGTRARQR
jgi:ABC-type dipeptide/oligopeptide/nickel transport system permease subunit